MMTDATTAQAPGEAEVTENPDVTEATENSDVTEATGNPDVAEATENPDATEVGEAQLPEASDSGQKSGAGQIDILLDTTMAVSVCLGEAQVQIRNLLQYGPGSVLQLDRKVGEPVDLYLRGIRFATGSLVVVGEQLGARVKEILATPSPEDPAEES